MKKTMKIFCYGDSNTFGFDPRSYFGERYAENIRWTGVLKSFGWNAVNVGMNGREIPSSPYEIDMSKLELRDISDSDMLLIMLGGNDLLNDSALSAEDVSEKMRHFIISLNLKCRTAIVVPPKMTLGSWTAECPEIIDKSVKLSQTYKKISDEIGTYFLDTSAVDFPMCSDGVHLLPEGHEKFAEGVNEFLLKTLC